MCDFDASGHLTVEVLEKLGVPRDADFYLCGPAPFLRDLSDGLKAWGVLDHRVNTENFGPGKSITPGIVDPSPAAPHPPEGPEGSGPRVPLVRKRPQCVLQREFSSLLELAEAVPVRWSCGQGSATPAKAAYSSAVSTTNPNRSSRLPRAIC